MYRIKIDTHKQAPFGSIKRSFCRTLAARWFFIKISLISVQNTGSKNQRSIYFSVMSIMDDCHAPKNFHEYWLRPRQYP